MVLVRLVLAMLGKGTRGCCSSRKGGRPERRVPSCDSVPALLKATWLRAVRGMESDSQGVLGIRTPWHRFHKTQK